MHALTSSDTGPTFTVKQLVCLWLDSNDLRAIRCVSKSWCRAASTTVLAVAVEGMPGGSRGIETLQQALAAYQQATKLRITAHPKLLKPRLKKTNYKSVAQTSQRRKLHHLKSSLLHQDSTSCSATSACSSGGYLSDQLTQQLLSKQLLCIDVPDRWKLLDRKGVWLQSLCELLVEQHPRVTGNLPDADAVELRIEPPQQAVSNTGSSSTVVMHSSPSEQHSSLACWQVSICSSKDQGSESNSSSSSSSSSSSGGDDVVACTACSVDSNICASLFPSSGHPRNCQSCKNNNLAGFSCLHCSNDASSWRSVCCVAPVNGPYCQQQQQRLLLKLPLLPSNSKTPWSLLSQLTNLGALLLRNACPLSGKQVSALAGCAPQLTCLHAAVTGSSSQLQSLSSLTGMQLLHLHGVNVAHRTISSAVLNLHQLRRLQICGDLQLQTLAQLPAACPQLRTLLLQQPLHILQHPQPRTRQPQQQQIQQQATLSELLAQLPKLQQLSLISVEPSRVMQPASKSCAGLLLRLQQRIQAVTGEAALHLAEGVVCTRSKAGQELADALRNPRRYTPETIVATELRRGSLRARLTAGSAAMCGFNGGQLLLQHAPEVVASCRMWQLTVRSGSQCDLQEELQLCNPAKLHIVTLPALTDVLSCLAWPIEFSAATPLPGKFRLTFPPSSLLCSVSIDSSSTRAGLVLDDAVLRAISASCPHLCFLKLKGVLCITKHGGAALHNMHKLQQLTLVDIRHQAIQHLSRLSQAAAAAVEPQPHMVDRLARLAGAKKDVRAIGWLLGCCLCAAKLHWGHPSYRAFAGCYVGMASCVLLLAAAPMAIADVVIHSAWGLQQQVASQLSRSAKALSSVPVVMRCWLPQQLQVLQLKGCCLGHHKPGHCCHNALQQLQVLQHASVRLQDRSNNGTAVIVTTDNNAGNKASSKCSSTCVMSSASASLIAVAEQRQPSASLVCKQLRKAARPSKQLHKRLVTERLCTLSVQVKALMRSAAAGSGLSLLLRWGGTRAAARLGFAK